MVYGIINFVKVFKGYRQPRARNPNSKSRKKRREPHYRKLEKRRSKEDIIYFYKTKKIERI